MLAHVAIDIAPAFVVVAHKTAHFVQTISAAGLLIAGHEFDDRMMLVLRLETSDLQPEPARRVGGIGIDVEIDWTRCRVPCRAQVVCTAEHKGRVA